MASFKFRNYALFTNTLKMHYIMARYSSHFHTNQVYVNVTCIIWKRAGRIISSRGSSDNTIMLSEKICSTQTAFSIYILVSQQVANLLYYTHYGADKLHSLDTLRYNCTRSVSIFTILTNNQVEACRKVIARSIRKFRVAFNEHPLLYNVIVTMPGMPLFFLVVETALRNMLPLLVASYKLGICLSKTNAQITQIVCHTDVSSKKNTLWLHSIRCYLFYLMCVPSIFCIVSCTANIVVRYVILCVCNVDIGQISAAEVPVEQPNLDEAIVQPKLDDVQPTPEQHNTQTWSVPLLRNFGRMVTKCVASLHIPPVTPEMLQVASELAYKTQHDINMSIKSMNSAAELKAAVINANSKPHILEKVERFDVEEMCRNWRYDNELNRSIEEVDKDALNKEDRIFGKLDNETLVEYEAAKRANDERTKENRIFSNLDLENIANKERMLYLEKIANNERDKQKLMLLFNIFNIEKLDIVKSYFNHPIVMELANKGLLFSKLPDEWIRYEINERRQSFVEVFDNHDTVFYSTKTGYRIELASDTKQTITLDKVSSGYKACFDSHGKYVHNFTTSDWDETYNDVLNRITDEKLYNVCKFRTSPDMNRDMDRATCKYLILNFVKTKLPDDVLLLCNTKLKK